MFQKSFLENFVSKTKNKRVSNRSHIEKLLVADSIGIAEDFPPRAREIFVEVEVALLALFGAAAEVNLCLDTCQDDLHLSALKMWLQQLVDRRALLLADALG